MTFDPTFARWRQERQARELLAEQRRQTEAIKRQGHGSGILGKLFFGALILSPTLRKQTGYVALMFMGFGVMLIVAGSGSNGTSAAVSGWGVSFLVLSMLLLVLVGASAIGVKKVGVVARDVKTELADENKNTPQTSDTPDDDDLSDTERALIRVLRNNDIPPDIVAESIREVLERRMGR